MLGVEAPLSMPVASEQITASRRKSRAVNVAAIEQLDRDDCLECWRQMFGAASSKYTSLELIRKALAYEAQAKAFGSHSNAVQRTLNAYLRAVRSELKAEKSAVTSFDNLAPTVSISVSFAEPNGIIEGSDSYENQTTRHHNNSVSGDNKRTIITGSDSTKSDIITQPKGKARANTLPKHTRSLKPTKPYVLRIRTGTHLVRGWNGRTYQVEALDKGFRLDGKTYRSLSAIAKKITGAHWSGPRFFGLES